MVLELMDQPWIWISRGYGSAVDMAQPWIGSAVDMAQPWIGSAVDMAQLWIWLCRGYGSAVNIHRFTRRRP